MRRTTWLATLLTIPTLLSAGLALGAPSPIELEQSLTGCWSGTLNYVDYQSNNTYALPLFTRIEAIEDGHTFLRRSKYFEGQKSGVAYITTLTLFNTAGDQVVSTGYRAGHAVETTEDLVTVSAYQDGSHWSEVYRSQGMDGGTLSDIEVTVTRDGDALAMVKQVKAHANPSDPGKIRNSTRVNRQADCHAAF